MCDALDLDDLVLGSSFVAALAPPRTLASGRLRRAPVGGDQRVRADQSARELWRRSRFKLCNCVMRIETYLIRDFDNVGHRVKSNPYD